VFRSLPAVVVITATFVGTGLIAAQRTITAKEASELVDTMLRSDGWNKLPGFVITVSDIRAEFANFYEVSARYDNPVGSGTVGNFAVERTTGVVWSFPVCGFYSSTVLLKAQKALRDRIGLTDSEYRNLQKPGPFCAPGQTPHVLEMGQPRLEALGEPTKTNPSSRKTIPRFEDFSVPTPLPSRQGPTYVANHVPDFQKEIFDVARQGPDFAGHFVVEQFTCGSGCTSFVIVNLRTSEVFRNDFNVAYSFCADGYEPGAELVYRPDSRLLIVNGAIETLSRTKGEVDGPCGHFYFLWDGRSLKQIHSVVPAAAKAPQ